MLELNSFVSMKEAIRFEWKPCIVATVNVAIIVCPIQGTCLSFALSCKLLDLHVQSNGKVCSMHGLNL